MNLTIELPDELGTALKALAQAKGVSANCYISRVLTNTLAPELGKGKNSGQPFKTGRGLLAQYGPAPSAEEIDSNRADMFSGFAQDS